RQPPEEFGTVRSFSRDRTQFVYRARVPSHHFPRSAAHSPFGCPDPDKPGYRSAKNALRPASLSRISPQILAGAKVSVSNSQLTGCVSPISQLRISML